MFKAEGNGRRKPCGKHNGCDKDKDYEPEPEPQKAAWAHRVKLAPEYGKWWGWRDAVWGGGMPNCELISYVSIRKTHVSRDIVQLAGFLVVYFYLSEAEV